MKALKAFLNRISRFIDGAVKKVKRLSARDRRRVLLLSIALALLLILLLILCVSSCSSTGEAAVAEAVGLDVRTRVRGALTDTPAGQSWIQGEVRLSSDVYRVSEPTTNKNATWPPDDEPWEDTDVAEPDEPESTPEPPAYVEATAEHVEARPESVAATPEAVTPKAQESTPEPTAEKYATLKKHDKSDAVTAIQNRLMELGYLDIDEPTDYFGTITETALILFQRQHDLKQDGVAGNETQSLLFSDDAQHYLMKEGAEGDDVKALQEQLVDLGYMSEKEVDRIYGPVTVSAVEAFQKRNGLHVDGLAGEKTLEMLYSEDAKISRELQKQQEAEAKKVTPTPKPTSKATAKPSGKPNSKKTATPKPTKKATPTPKKDTRIDKFIAAAKSKIGCEYVLGAKGPNKFDCSGFVYWCLKQAGVGGTRLNALGYSHKSSWKLIENMNSLKKGDILFFRSDNSKSVNHTGIYVGGGTMIDASSGHGKVVKRAISAYFKRNFVCARRPWND